MAEGWAAFEETCNEVGAGELPQLLRYVKMATTPTPTPTPTKFKTMDVEATATTSADPPKMGEFIEKPIHISVGAEPRCTSVGTATLPPHTPEWVWTPTSMLSTQRRP